MVRNWKPLTQLNLIKDTEQLTVPWFLLLADARGNSYSGKLVRCGPTSLTLDRAGTDETFIYANRNFQFILIGAPPTRTFQQMEADLFHQQSGGTNALQTPREERQSDSTQTD